MGRYGNIIMSGWGLAPPQETVDQIAKRYVCPKCNGTSLKSDLFVCKISFQGRPVSSNGFN